MKKEKIFKYFRLGVQATTKPDVALLYLSRDVRSALTIHEIINYRADGEMEDETSGKSFFRRKKERKRYLRRWIRFDAKFQICSKNKIVIQK